jgi:hypothetical protein
LQCRSSDAVAAHRRVSQMCGENVGCNHYNVGALMLCILKCTIFLPCAEKLVWRIFFFHFISHIFYHQRFAPIGLQKTNAASGWLVKIISQSQLL